MEKRFWDLIAVACRHDVQEDFTEEWGAALVEQLKTLPPELIVRFDRWFDEKTDALYTWDHWGAAYFINGGASDDGFYYWRCWLVGMGKAVYEAALADPDSLADVLDPERDVDYEAEIYGAGRNVWEELGRTLEEFDRLYDAPGPPPALGKPRGRKWDVERWPVRRRRFPRLVALLGGEDD